MPTLCQRLDTVQRLASPGPFPVREDLILPEPRPFSNELQRPGLQAADEDFPVRRDRGASAGMVGMEVGHRVIRSFQYM